MIILRFLYTILKGFRGPIFKIGKHWSGLARTSSELKLLFISICYIHVWWLWKEPFSHCWEITDSYHFITGEMTSLDDESFQKDSVFLFMGLELWEELFMERLSLLFYTIDDWQLFKDAWNPPVSLTISKLSLVFYLL